jgi:hypothetical protein
MRIKKFLPLWFRRKIVNWRKYDVAKRQSFLFDEDHIIEFRLSGFNENMDLAFSHLVELYSQILYEDPQWHYFYEDHYSLVRCSLKYRDAVKKFFDDRNITYEWPPNGWVESTHTTYFYREEFKILFHTFSVLTIKMHLNNDGANYLNEATDRVCHCFFNHATYLAHVSGITKNYEASGYPVDYWEAARMAELTAFRAYNVGRCKQQKNIAEYFSKALGIKGEPGDVYEDMVTLVKTAASMLENKGDEKCSE